MAPPVVPVIRTGSSEHEEHPAHDIQNNIDQSEEELSLDVNGPVIKVQSAENPDEDIPLKDLDHEPDMMKDESSSTSSIADHDQDQDLEWQEEVISEKPPLVNDLNIRYMEPNESRQQDIHAVEIKPQPRPPTPIEVDGIDSPSPPPPPPEDIEINDDDLAQEDFPAPPMETLPSPPPELLRDSPDPER